MGGPVSESDTESMGGRQRPGPMLEVVILAAEDLKNVNVLGKMSVYVMAWIESALKRSTSVRHKTGKNAVWNDCLFLPVSDDMLLNPHSSLTVQVYSTGTVSPSVVGTSYLALADIARMKASKTNSDEGDIVTLPLHRRSGRTQGSIKISVNLTGATIQQIMYALDNGDDGWAIEMPTTSSSVPDEVAVMGYPAVQSYGYPPCTDCDDDNAAFLPSAPPIYLATSFESSLTSNTNTEDGPTTNISVENSVTTQPTRPPPPARPPPPLPSSPLFSNNGNVDPHPCAQARDRKSVV